MRIGGALSSAIDSEIQILPIISVPYPNLFSYYSATVATTTLGRGIGSHES